MPGLRAIYRADEVTALPDGARMNVPGKSASRAQAVRTAFDSMPLGSVAVSTVLTCTETVDPTRSMRNAPDARCQFCKSAPRRPHRSLTPSFKGTSAKPLNRSPGEYRTEAELCPAPVLGGYRMFANPFTLLVISFPFSGWSPD